MRPSFSIISHAIAAATLLLASAAQANVVTNGSFETGDFTGWTPTGITTFNGVFCPGPGPSVQSGNCSAFFGPLGGLGGITQTLATVAGAAYDISFWTQADGFTPSEIVFNWDGGANEFDQVNPPAGGFVLHSFQLVASSASTTIAFSFRNDPSFIFLDNVVVDASVPEPTSLALVGLAIAGLGAMRRRRQ